MLSVMASGAQAVSADVVLTNGSEVAPNIAVLHVKDDGVYVDLEVYVEDIPLFADMLPIGLSSDFVEGEPEVEQESDQGSAQAKSRALSIVARDEQPLHAEIRKLEYRTRIDRASPLAGQRDPFSGQIVPSPPKDPRVLFVEVFFPFQNSVPNELTIMPPSQDGEPLVTIGMQVFDREVPVTDFSFLAKPAELKIHWPDPWDSRFSAESLNRKAQDGTSTFLYIEPREVRHETLIRLRELAPWIGEAFEVGQTLSPQHSALIVNQAASFLASRNPVTIDGKSVQPSNATATLLELTSQGFQVVEPGKEVSVNNTFIGAILSFSSADLPDQVAVTWDMFDEEISRVATISNDIAGPFFGAVTPADPQFHWQNHLLQYQRASVTQIPVEQQKRQNPAVALIAGIISAVSLCFLLLTRGKVAKRASCVTMIAVASATFVFSGYLPELPWSKPAPPEQQVAEDILRSMVENLNTVTLETSSAARKAELAHIVTAASLGDIATEVERGLVIRTPGGSLATVTDISALKVERVDPTLKPGGFSTLAKWTVKVQGGHWGHAHIRAVTFRVLAEVVPESGQWKLDGLTVIEARDPNA
ncbi:MULTISPECIES: hypothetical protein [unclassified Ruegeria]|nr:MULTISPECIES: hypothetical protein [unclassified Ruegeria]NOD89457.1 hypothetical protein [Ruegeria sp. HKCCD4318]NOE13780.1 hypothetical protein [Ruegeria sp. HKCCD4318-2]NOG08285.1 hypothetical protein [Ruegeria sp. HKCCD4315]